MNPLFKYLLFSLCAMSLSVSAQSPEDALIAVLKSDAPQQQKADACIDLARLGTKASVAPLAALLGDEKLSHMARYGLETIPDQAVDAALRAALGQLKGRLLAGVIQSVGVRRDTQAVDVLAKLLGAPDGEVAAASAVALGRIGTPPAVAALKASLGKVPAASEGLLRCAEAAPSRDEAVAMYDAVRTARVPSNVKMAALRGAILARGTTAGLPQLLEQLRSDDPTLFSVALRTGLELPGAEVSRALADELGNLPAAKQVCVTAVLGERGDAAASPALIGLARGGVPESRVAAIAALARLGGAESVPVLAELAGSDDTGVAEAAQTALAGFSGPTVDATIIALLGTPDPKLRRVGVELVGRRRIASAMPELLRLAGGAEPPLCGASLKVLADLAGVKELPALLGILQSTAAVEAAERAVSAVCARQSVAVPGAIVIRKAVYGVLPDGPQKDVTAKVAALVKAGNATLDVANGTFGDAAPGKVKRFTIEYAVNGVSRSAVANEGATLRLDMGAGSIPPAVIEPLMAAYGQAQGAPKLALLRILCSAGGEKALGIVRAAAVDPHAELKEAAQRALCDWPLAEVLPDLEKIIQSEPNQKIKILALRGYVKLVPAQEVAAAQKLASLKKAFGWAGRDEERRLVLASLSAAPTPEALAFAADSFDVPGLKEDACQAAVAIAENLAGEPGPVAEIMEKVSKSSGNEVLVKRAKACQAQARKAEAEKQAAGDETGFVPMFNGRDLSGWESRGGTWWKAVDGVLTGESTKENPLVSNNHLIWKGGTPGDFELRVEFRLTKSANSGIQLRAEAVADRDTGYQADMNGGGHFVGFLYHPKMHLIGARGEKVVLAPDGKKTSQRFADSAELQKLFNVEDWNSIRVICRGPAITIYVNGVLMSQFEDHRPESPRQGAITLQLHKGPPMKNEFRRLRIKELK
ncbi:MAG TPA: DUF1080 domain-containing protein [Kiritimatiellia bacterium]|nr:DUF1080 domain-containing protein [Kiritimatiellia bacterium]HPS06182.1 DUF1080 domain-containing protein [Kiritimatiellia bacterium]